MSWGQGIVISNNSPDAAVAADLGTITRLEETKFQRGRGLPNKQRLLACLPEGHLLSLAID